MDVHQLEKWNAERGSGDRTRGPVQSWECPGGKGGRQTPHVGGNGRVHVVHLFAVDFLLKIVYLFCDFFFPKESI